MYSSGNRSSIGDEHTFESAVMPYIWRGEIDCIVGPFKTEQVARFFFEYLIVDEHQLELDDALIQVKDSWYLNLCD